MKEVVCELRLMEPLDRLREAALEVLRAFVYRNDAGVGAGIEAHQKVNVLEARAIKPLQYLNIAGELVVEDNNEARIISRHEKRGVKNLKSL